MVLKQGCSTSGLWTNPYHPGCRAPQVSRNLETKAVAVLTAISLLTNFQALGEAPQVG